MCGIEKEKWEKRKTEMKRKKPEKYPHTQFILFLHVDIKWQVGIHGIQIEFHDSKKRYNATYLPDVAKEQGMEKIKNDKAYQIINVLCGCRTCLKSVLLRVNTNVHKGVRYCVGCRV